MISYNALVVNYHIMPLFISPLIWLALLHSGFVLMFTGADSSTTSVFSYSTEKTSFSMNSYSTPGINEQHTYN